MDNFLNNNQWQVLKVTGWHLPLITIALSAPKDANCSRGLCAGLTASFNAMEFGRSNKIINEYVAVGKFCGVQGLDFEEFNEDVA